MGCRRFPGAERPHVSYGGRGTRPSYTKDSRARAPSAGCRPPVPDEARVLLGGASVHGDVRLRQGGPLGQRGCKLGTREHAADAGRRRAAGGPGGRLQQFGPCPAPGARVSGRAPRVGLAQASCNNSSLPE